MNTITNFASGLIGEKAWFIFSREIKNYFNTPIGYVFAVSCLLFTFFFFFAGLAGIIPEFWEAKNASIRGYMNLLPLTFILMVPAVTMRVWAEERKSGTIELLRTFPVRDIDLVLGKFLAAWAFISGLIWASFPMAILIWLIGPLDWGVTITMYIGSTLMAGAYVAMGVVISAVTREQIVAFILILFLSVFMFAGNYLVTTNNLPDALGRHIGFFSHSFHFASFSRGVLNLGDIVYYISFIGLMLFINVRILRSEK